MLLVATINRGPILPGGNEKRIFFFMYLLGRLSMIFLQREVVLATDDQPARFRVLQPDMAGLD